MGHEKENVEYVRRDRERRYGLHIKKSKPLLSAKESRELRDSLREGIWGITKILFLILLVLPLKIFWLIISAPFKLMGRLYRSKAPLIVKIILTIVFAVFLLVVLSYFSGQSG